MAKPDPNHADNRSNNNQSSGSACGTCGGSGVITRSETDRKGNTVTTTTDCPSCN